MRPFGGDIQAPDREHPRHLGHEVEHRLAPLGVRGGAHDADWLVEQVVGEPFPDRQRYPVHFDVVVGAVCPLAEAGRSSIDPHAALDDQQLTGPAAPEARLGEHFLEPFSCLGGPVRRPRGSRRSRPHARAAHCTLARHHSRS